MKSPAAELPAGRPTLVCGGAGCGKTLLATTFLVKGALDCDEPGVFVSFDERIPDLAANVASLGFDLPALTERGLIAMDHVQLDRQSIMEAGNYDLEGLFVRLGHELVALAQSAWFLIASTFSSREFRTQRSCGPSLDACSLG